MAYLEAIVLVVFILVPVINRFVNALADEKSKFNSKDLNKDIEYTTNKIIAEMYVYWKLRMKNSESEDEGVECFLSASKSEAQFRALIDKSMNIKTEEEQEAAAVAKSPNVLPLKFN
jgi:hypothetical protein